MKKDDDILDKLFQEKLEGFSQEPPAYVWSGIQDQLAATRRKKLLTRYRWIAVAAMLLLAFMAGWYFNEQPLVPQMVEKETQTIESESVPDSNDAAAESFTEKESTIREELAMDAGSGKDKFTEASEKKMNHPARTVSARETSSTRAKAPDRIKSLTARLEQSVVVPSTFAFLERDDETILPASELEILNSNINRLADAGRNTSRWKMGLNISPGYSSYTSKHTDSYAGTMTRQSGEGVSNLSGGLSFQYRTSGRWSIESGVYYASNGQESVSSPQVFGVRTESGPFPSTSEHLHFNTEVIMEDNLMMMNSPAGVIELENLPFGAELATNPEADGAFSNSLITQGDFSQVFDLIEIPVYVRYLLVESKLDVELVGGFSAGMVVGNNAFIENQFGIQRIGQTRDISAINVSGALGIGFNYKLGKQLAVALEPRLNYYLNSLSKNPDVDFHPYRIGIFTGLNYSF